MQTFVIIFLEDDRFLMDCLSLLYTVKCCVVPSTFGPMRRFPAVPWTRPSASPHPPAVGLNPASTPGTEAPPPYAAAEQQVNTGDHLRDKRNQSDKSSGPVRQRFVETQKHNNQRNVRVAFASPTLPLDTEVPGLFAGRRPRLTASFEEIVRS